MILPFVERVGPNVVLQTALLDQELCAFEKRRCDRGRLLAQQYVDGLRRRHAVLTAAAHVVQAAFRVLAVHETV